MRRRRIVVVSLVAAVAAVGARVAVPAPNHQAAFSAALSCGVERWNIKTLKDRPRLLPARATTVAHLTSLRRPSYLPAGRRLLGERRIYSLIAAVTLKRSEDDLDYHLVLRSGGRTMIAETPSALCTKGATATRRKQMLAARRVARLCGRARVVGSPSSTSSTGRPALPGTESSCIPSLASLASPGSRHRRRLRHPRAGSAP